MLNYLHTTSQPLYNTFVFLPGKGSKGIMLTNINTIFNRSKGGVEAERLERERWIDRERQKIMESVNRKSSVYPVLCELVGVVWASSLVWACIVSSSFNCMTICSLRAARL